MDEETYRPLRTGERLGKPGNKEEPLLVTALSIAVQTSLAIRP